MPSKQKESKSFLQWYDTVKPELKFGEDVPPKMFRIKSCTVPECSIGGPLQTLRWVVVDGPKSRLQKAPGAPMEALVSPVLWWWIVFPLPNGDGDPVVVVGHYWRAKGGGRQVRVRGDGLRSECRRAARWIGSGGGESGETRLEVLGHMCEEVLVAHSTMLLGDGEGRGRQWHGHVRPYGGSLRGGWWGERLRRGGMGQVREVCWGAVSRAHCCRLWR